MSVSATTIPPVPGGHGPGVARAVRARSRGRAADVSLAWAVRIGAVCILAMMAALVGVLAVAAAPSIREFGPAFLVGREWRPNELERPRVGPDGSVVIEDGEVVQEVVPAEFGALPMIFGTAVSSVLALGIAVPLSVGASLFLVRLAPRLRLAGPLSFLIEFLAAVPSIAYGIWGLFVLAPFLQSHVEPFLARVFGDVPGLRWLFHHSVTVGGAVIERPIALTGRNMLCGALVLAIMVIPIITAISRDVLRAVPRAQVEGALALGATWWESCVCMLQYGRAGLFGAAMLGLARAAGETIAVTMVIGNSSQIVLSPFAPAQTMSSLLANEFAEAGTDLHRSALLQVALILLAMSLLFNVVARWLVVGARARPGDAA